LLRTRETVLMATPAACATSLILALRLGGLVMGFGSALESMRRQIGAMPRAPAPGQVPVPTLVLPQTKHTAECGSTPETRDLTKSGGRSRCFRSPRAR